MCERACVCVCVVVVDLHGTDFVHGLSFWGSLID